MQCLAAHRGFSKANFTRRHHHLIYIISRLCILFSLFYKYTHSTHCPMGLTAISDHHLFLTRGAGLFLEVNQGKNGKIFFSIFSNFSHFFKFFHIFPNFSRFFPIFPNFSQIFLTFRNFSQIYLTFSQLFSTFPNFPNFTTLFKTIHFSQIFP